MGVRHNLDYMIHWLTFILNLMNNQTMLFLTSEYFNLILVCCF